MDLIIKQEENAIHQIDDWKKMTSPLSIKEPEVLIDTDWEINSP